MNALGRTRLIAEYELRRALANRKVHLLIILGLIFEIAPFIVLTQIRVITLSETATKLMWLIGVLAPQTLFVHIVAIIVSVSSMAEEYESGTADILLSKPLRRIEYFFGKFFGGYILVILISSLITVLGVVLAEISFGPQVLLGNLPWIHLSIIFSSLLFYSVGFMVGELFRKTTLAYMLTTTTLISGVILAGFLSFAYTVTQDQIYLAVEKSLPSWSAISLPFIVTGELFRTGLTSVPFLSTAIQTGGTLTEALLSAVIYISASISIALVRLLKSDVSRKTV